MAVFCTSDYLKIAKFFQFWMRPPINKVKGDYNPSTLRLKQKDCKITYLFSKQKIIKRAEDVPYCKGPGFNPQCQKEKGKKLVHTNQSMCSGHVKKTRTVKDTFI